MKTRISRGFTLIELLVVLIILGLLAGIVLPNVIGQVGGSKSKTARIQIEELGAALDIFRLEVGRYPTSQEGLRALVEQPGDVRGWNGPYLKKRIVPTDPWDRPYHYRAPGRHGEYDLYTLGRDGAEGGEGEDADVVSWE
jgi:general secretion pathway protein G